MKECVFFINPYWTGHHETFFKIFVQTAKRIGYTVVTLSQNPQKLASVGDHNFQIHDANTEIRKKMKDKVAFWNYCNHEVQKIAHTYSLNIKLVFFLALDNMMHRELEAENLDTLFTFPWSGLYFTPRPKKRSLLKRVKLFFKKENLSIFASRHCHSVGVLDEGYQGTLEHKIKKPVVVFPDFIDTAEPNMDFPAISGILQRKGNRKVIGLYGAMEKRKGLLTFLRAAESIRTDEWFFVVAGKLKRDYFSDDENRYIDELISKQPSNCYFYFEFIPTEHEFNALINISDLVFAVYRDFPHSSNLITKAAYFSKPVVVSGGYLMAERVKKKALGYVIDQDNSQQLLELLQGKGNGEFDPKQAEMFYLENSQGRLESVLEKALKL